MDYRHTSVYQDRARRPAKTLGEALGRLGQMVQRRRRDEMIRRYPALGNEQTRRIGLRILGEKDD